MTARAAFGARFDVPRETMAGFDRYAGLLSEWQARMNLVGSSTLPQMWDRHFADSAQLLALAGRGKSWLDIGAGAGFPGLVIALLDPSAKVTLVESITKKCAFLTDVVAVLGLTDRVVIENRRIESMDDKKFDIVTARALATLDRLFEWGLPHAGSSTSWLLPKGRRVGEELIEAARRFSFDHQLIPSQTDDGGRIIVATKVKRR